MAMASKTGIHRFFKSLRCLPAALVLLLCATLECLAQDYFVREVISVRPGEHQTREFLIHDRFRPSRPGPVEAFIIYCWGITEPADELTVEVSIMPRGEKGWVVFCLLAAGYSLELGPVINFFRATSPQILKGTLPIQSTFGIYYIGVAILAASSSRIYPVPFSITFSAERPEQQVSTHSGQH